MAQDFLSQFKVEEPKEKKKKKDSSLDQFKVDDSGNYLNQFKVEEEPKELPIKQEQAVTDKERFAIKSVMNNDPDVIGKYLKKKYKGAEVRNKDGQIQVKKPGDDFWGVVDEDSITVNDFTDVLGDVAEMAITAGGTALGAIGLGPVGGVAGASAAGSAIEAGKQFAQQQLGATDDFDATDIVMKGGVEGAFAAAGPLMGKAAKFLGRKLEVPLTKLAQTEAAKSLKLGAKAIDKITKEFGDAGFRAYGKLAKEFGLDKVFTSAAKLKKNTGDALKSVGDNIDNGYRELTKRSNNIEPAESFIKNLSKKASIKTPKEHTQFVKEMDNVAFIFNPPARIVRKTLPGGKNVSAPNPDYKKWSSKVSDMNLDPTKISKNMTPSDKWEMSKMLDVKAKSFDDKQGTIVSKALSNIAKDVRKDLAQEAKELGMDSLNEESIKYAQLKVIDKAFQKAKVDTLKGKALGHKTAAGMAAELTSEVIHRGLQIGAKVGAPVASTVAKTGEKLMTPAGQAAAAATGTAVSSIAERLGLVDKKK